MIVAIDPGKNIGIAYVSLNGELIKSEIISATELNTYEFPNNATIVIGNGTTSKKIIEIIEHLEPIIVDEKNTSLIAKELYFKNNPPCGLMKLIPKGLRSPNVLIDDYAAFAIALRYLDSLDSSK